MWNLYDKMTEQRFYLPWEVIIKILPVPSKYNSSRDRFVVLSVRKINIEIYGTSPILKLS